MSDPYLHAVSSARKFGGVAEDYLHIHQWFDQTKAHCPDARHRLILHNSFGIQLCIDFHGQQFARKSDGKIVLTRLIAEQHVEEDYGVIPSLDFVLSHFQMEPWMWRGAKKLSRHFLGKDKDSEH